jgi:SAP domain-containing ribonucleoprotein
MTKPSSMTVAVLRKELKKRNLDTEGLKAVLVERLQKALDAEATGDETTAAAPAEPEVRDARGRASFFARSPERSPSRASRRSAVRDARARAPPSKTAATPEDDAPARILPADYAIVGSRESQSPDARI